MGFKKYLKNILLLVISCIIGNYIYDKHIKIGLNTVVINVHNLCKNAESSYFIFNFSDRNVTINDNSQAIYKIYTNKVNLDNDFYLECKNRRKTFIFNHGTILKTKNDSIDIEENYEKIHGYMGILEKNNCYSVDKNGRFNKCK